MYARGFVTTTQLIDSSNNIHMQRANVDEVILLDVIGADLAAASVMNKGSSKILSELFTILFDDNAPTKNTNTNKVMKLAPGIFVPKIHLKTG